MLELKRRAGIIDGRNRDPETEMEASVVDVVPHWGYWSHISEKMEEKQLESFQILSPRSGWKDMDFVALLHHPIQLLPLALTWVRDAAVGDNLRQQDPERPHIRLDGEGPVVNGFWCCPLNWKLGP